MAKISHMCVSPKSNINPKRLPSQPLVTVGSCAYLWRFPWLSLNQALLLEPMDIAFPGLWDRALGQMGEGKHIRTSSLPSEQIGSKVLGPERSRHRRVLSSLATWGHSLVSAIFKYILKQESDNQMAILFKSPQQTPDDVTGYHSSTVRASKDFFF